MTEDGEATKGSITSVVRRALFHLPILQVSLMEKVKPTHVGYDSALHMGLIRVPATHGSGQCFGYCLLGIAIPGAIDTGRKVQ